ncbi:MAG: phosphosulfolactate synthase [Bacteroidetes bacterium]|nr:phosphosulfolactate synthase [Bacteroidota bacterium]MBL7105218.1 phosphosulfolactate synthase [Bacteroidales bacterium]
MNYNLPWLPERPAKPRKTGIAMVMDKGLSIREAENLVSVAGHLIDFLKLGFGTSMITNNLKEKIKIYRDGGINVYFGGTLFEAFLIRNLFDDYRKYLEKFGVNAVEISDGSMEMDNQDKCDYINKLSQDYIVLSEVGSKDAGVEISNEEWILQMDSEIKAGSFKVIAEARESGTVGIYKADGKANISLINDISAKVPLDSIIWEAPIKSQQVWFIKHFGANVNLGNIAPAEIIPLETLRLGLRGDTFMQFLPDDLKQS